VNLQLFWDVTMSQLMKVTNILEEALCSFKMMVTLPVDKV